MSGSAVVNVTPAPENDAAAQAVADAKALARNEQGLEGNVSTPTAERPSWCPEKYARHNEDGTFNSELSATEMAKGMDHLNKMVTQQQQKKSGDDIVDEGTVEDNTDDGGDESDDKSTDEPLTSPDFWESLTDEYNDNGDLSAESRQIIKDLGVPDRMVEDFIEGQKARGDQWHSQATGVLGANGSAEYDALVDWASRDGNMSEAEAAVFNEAVRSGDLTKAQVAIRDLKSQYIKAEGSYDGLMLAGNSSSVATSASPFPSREQMTAAINDPRYSKDPAYRKTVEDRIKVSTL